MRILALTEESDRSEAALLQGLKDAGNDVTILKLQCSSKLDFRTMRKLRNTIRNSSFDIIHAFTARALSNVLLATVGMKTRIVAYRGTTGHVSRLDPSSWLTFLNPRVAAISCVSDAVKKYLLSCGVPLEKLYVIYKGHDIAWYTHGKSIDLSQFGIPTNSLVITCVANMRPVKGVDLLIDAVRDLVQAGASPKPVHLLLIGEVRESSVRDVARGCEEYIHFAGFRSDATELVSASTVYVQPSRGREGLPKAVIEAMAQAIPVVVSDAGGLPELVRDGQDGLVCAAGRSASLRDSIKRLLDDESLRKHLGSAAQLRISHDFSAKNTVQGTLAMYSRLL